MAKKPKMSVVGYRAGDGSGPDVAATLARGGVDKKVQDDQPGKIIVKRQAQEHAEHHIEWQRFQDSLEGGARYRNADYGMDRKGLPLRNLFRHRREYPDPQQNPTLTQGFTAAAMGENANASGTGIGVLPGQIGADAGATAQDDEFELRRSRTPVRSFMAHCIAVHLSKLYDQEVRRKGPAILEEWWKDVDGRGTPIDDYMKEKVAPLLFACGTMDVALDRPRLPAGKEPAKSKADEKALGIDRCIISYILPQNMKWWKVDMGGQYLQCLIREWIDPQDLRRPDEDPGTDVVQQIQTNREHWRHWTNDWITLYNHDGSRQIERIPNPYGFIPIQRLMAATIHRQDMVGKSEYAEIADLERDYYNVSSELTLSNTLHAHPALSGPEDFLKADNTITFGPGNILPVKYSADKGKQDWAFVSPPKDPAASLRQEKQDIIDEIHRIACLAKPVGTTGTTGGTVAQSGISKQLDTAGGDKLLTARAKTLAKAERLIAERALECLLGHQLTPAERQQIKIDYPTRFQLFGATELLAIYQQFQMVVSASGALPMTEAVLLRAIIRSALPGLDDATYEAIEKEIELMLATKSELKEQQHELNIASVTSAADAIQNGGSEEQQAGSFPVGQTNSTMVGNMEAVQN